MTATIAATATTEIAMTSPTQTAVDIRGLLPCQSQRGSSLATRNRATTQTADEKHDTMRGRRGAGIKIHASAEPGARKALTGGFTGLRLTFLQRPPRRAGWVEFVSDNSVEPCHMSSGSCKSSLWCVASPATGGELLTINEAMCAPSAGQETGRTAS